MGGDGSNGQACSRAKGTFRWRGSADPGDGAESGHHAGHFSTDDESVVTAESEIPYDSNGNGKEKDEFEFSMSITRIHEDPRVTKPYTEKQWGQIEALGHQIDEELKAGDVRLSMGGEPTFVSVDDMDGPEWNSAALGPMKYRRGDMLARRLRDRFAPGGFLHHGQGKWYPGESLPRLGGTGLYWRKDGHPIWRDPTAGGG